MIFARKCVTLLPIVFLRMRKPGFILLLFICCLCLTEAGKGMPVQIQTHAAGQSIDRTTDRQWLVERRCNSDLNLPSPLREVAPQQTARLSQHGGTVFSGRDERHAGRSNPSVWETSSTHPFVPVSGARAADYYVYRLRRLII